jgi:hypothetical protein
MFEKKNRDSLTKKDRENLADLIIYQSVVNILESCLVLQHLLFLVGNREIIKCPLRNISCQD